MAIDKASFLLLTATLAAGTTGGYFAGKNNLLGTPATPDPAARANLQAQAAPPPPAATSAAPVATAPAAAVPACDDTSGTPGECPPASFYSAEEGGCGALPVKRCTDFKQAMKPKIAAQAVACLNALKPYERCDEKRTSLCGHVALMSACVEPEKPTSGASEGATAAAAPASAATPSSGVAAACEAIVRGCAGSSMAPSARDCRATLSGMTEIGRNNTIECMKTHCNDKGLVGCEGAPKSEGG